MQVGSAGDPPVVASTQAKVTLDTSGSPVYGDDASVASYVFQVRQRESRHPLCEMTHCLLMCVCVCAELFEAVGMR